MRIVMISNWFAEKMGYIENCLPKALASLGHEVHLVTSNVQIYFDSPLYKEIYEPYLGPAIVDCEVKTIDGYTLHRLPYQKYLQRLHIKGLLGKLRLLRPQIVQTFEVYYLPPLIAALAKPQLNYKLFTEVHATLSSMPSAFQHNTIGRIDQLRLMLFTFLPGRLSSFFTTKCYAATVDCAEVAVRFFGVQEQKISISPLGVDTDLFTPVVDEALREARSRLRQQLGFGESDIVCIYTGRFTKEDKNPLCLAQAIAGLVAQGESFRGLFVGDGPQEDAIRTCPGCVVRPFVPFRELPALFRAADIGVWPKGASMSMLDASACGLAIIVSDREQAVVERVQGNGATYNENDPGDLMCTLQTLRDAGRRNQLGGIGAAKILREHSWLSVARRRLEDYEAALRS